MVLLTGAAALFPEVTMVVHPTDTAAHPDVPAGWRWSVQVGGGRAGDLSRCANAGWCADEQAARLQGAQVAAAVLNALRMLGMDFAGRVLTLGFDPIPAGEDRVRTRPAPPIGSGVDGFRLED